MRAFEKRPVSTPASPIAASSQEDTDYSPGGSSSSAESFRGGPPDKARSHVAAVVNMHVFLWFHKKCCVLQLHVLSPLWKVFAYDKTFKRVTCGCDSPSGGICGRQYAFVVGGTTTQLWRHLKKRLGNCCVVFVLHDAAAHDAAGGMVQWHDGMHSSSIHWVKFLLSVIVNSRECFDRKSNCLLITIRLLSVTYGQRAWLIFPP